MKPSTYITLLFCGVMITVPAQNNRSILSGTTDPNKTTTQSTPETLGMQLFSTNLSPTQELENQRLEAIKAIELTTQLLSETSVSVKNSLNRLNLLAQQLLSRKKVVTILGQEIAEIDRKIKTMTDEIELLDKDLTKTKENYTRSVQNQQQEHRSTQHQILLILSADNLSQSYRRMRYFREYADWQKEEGERIVSKQAEIKLRKKELESTRKDKQDLLAARVSENKKLISEEQLQQKEVHQLNTKQKELQLLLTQKRKEADALNSRIEQLIVEDIKNSEKNLKKAMAEQDSRELDTEEKLTGESIVIKETATETTASSTTSSETASTKTAVLTETASTEMTTSTETAVSNATRTETATTTTGTASRTTAAIGTTGTASRNTATSSSSTNDSYVLLGSEVFISKEFENSKGKLPFPLTGNYTIVSTFGEHQHQELSYVRTNNNGIDIQTTAGTEACAIFRGVVTRVFVMPGFNNNVIIRHGNYLTVYSNLSNVYVKAGDVVNSSQIIGQIFTDTEKSNATILHFQLWKERTKLNPSVWVK